MQGRKIQTQARAVAKALGELKPADRFRLVSFSSSASELTSGWTAATPDNVKAAVRTVEGLTAGGSTNLFDAMGVALPGLAAVPLAHLAGALAGFAAGVPWPPSVVARHGMVKA
jgi:Ca-activated chloride channel family protein